MCSLTGNIEWSVTANGLSQVVACNTGVDALIRFAPPSVYDAKEEEGAAGQEHAVRAGVILICLHALTVLIPLYTGAGSALGFAVESGRFPLGDYQIRGVLHNPRCTLFKPWSGPCEVKTRANVIQPSDLRCMNTYRLFVGVQRAATLKVHNPF